MPQEPDDTRRLFEAACESAELGQRPLHPGTEARGAAIALALAREWSVPDLEKLLVAAIEADFEPTWDRARGEFTWGLGLREEYPRGQYNAFLGAAEAMSRGAWARLSEAPLADCPQVVGVDFPNVALTRALWRDGALELSLSALREEPAGRTSFRVQGIGRERAWGVRGNREATLDRRDDELVVTVALRSMDLRVEPTS